MTDYRYVFSSLRDEEVVEEIPLYGVYMDMELNVGGQFNGTFQLDQTGKMNSALLDATLPGKTFVVAERNNNPIWAGIVWSRTYQSQAKSVQLFAQSFENYPQYQLMQEDYLDVDDQRNLFINLWNDMQSKYGSNINIITPPLFTPVVVEKGISILSTDYKFYLEVMKSIADGLDGFDWYIGVSKQNGLYMKNLQIGYPTLGVPETQFMTVFEYPGSITNYYNTESMAEAGTNVISVGSGEGSGMSTLEQEQTIMLDQGWPRYDKVVAMKDINNITLFSDLAQREFVNRRPPMEIIKVTTKANEEPEFGSWSLGDTVKVVIKDPRFPTGVQRVVRVVRWELHPQQSSGIEEVNIIFQGDEGV